MKRAATGLVSRPWFGLVVVALTIAVVGGFNALRWHADGMCGASIDASRCRSSMATVLAVGASVALVVWVALRWAGRRRAGHSGRAATALLPGAVALTLGIGLGWPVDTTWSHRCGYLSGGAPAIALLDRGPFTTRDLPNLRDDALIAGMCDPAPDTVWRLGPFGSEPVGSP